jgi:hypothetical protein
MMLAVALLALLSANAFADDSTTALRIRFGLKDKQPTDWSGSITPVSGKVESIRGWRWVQGDVAEGNNFTVGTRRGQAQGAAQRRRAQQGQQQPMQDNGIIVTLSGVKPNDVITFDAKPGKFAFKLSDLPLGQKKLELDGSLALERVPAAEEVVKSPEEDDYPAAANAKDGTLYVAYLSFKHGEDFDEPARERPATPESAPQAGPGAQGKVRKIEKPEDLDYLAQPTGGEQIHLRMRKADGSWGEPVAVTDGKLELYRPAIAVDENGKVWVFYSAHVDADKNLDHGNWELMARPFNADGQPAGDAINVSGAPGPTSCPPPRPTRPARFRLRGSARGRTDSTSTSRRRTAKSSRRRSV